MSGGAQGSLVSASASRDSALRLGNPWRTVLTFRLATPSRLRAKSTPDASAESAVTAMLTPLQSEALWTPGILEGCRPFLPDAATTESGTAIPESVGNHFLEPFRARGTNAATGQAGRQDIYSFPRVCVAGAPYACVSPPRNPNGFGTLARPKFKPRHGKTAPREANRGPVSEYRREIHEILTIFSIST